MTSDSDSENSVASTVTTATDTSVTSDVSVASRRSERVRKRKRHDDSLEEDLKKRLKNTVNDSKAVKGRPVKKTKESGVKPNKLSVVQRRAAINDAKTIARLVANGQEGAGNKAVEQGSTQAQTASSNNRSVDDDGEQITPRKQALLKRISELEKKIPGTSETLVKNQSVNPNPSGGLGSGLSLKLPLNNENSTTSRGTISKKRTTLGMTANTSGGLGSGLSLMLPLNNENSTTSRGTISNERTTPGMTANLMGFLETSESIPKSNEEECNKSENQNDEDSFVNENDITVIENKITNVSDNEEHENDNYEAKKDLLNFDLKKKKKKKKAKKLIKKRKEKKRSKRSKKNKSNKKYKKKKDNRDSSSSDSDDSTTSSSDSSSPSDEAKKKHKRKKQKVESDQLLYNSESSDVEEIVPKSSIYMKKAAIAAIRRSCRSHTSAARMFLVGVFTNDALCSCSLKGNRPKGPQGKVETPRPPLFYPAVEAVLEAAEKVAKEKKIEIKDPRIVNHELGTKQSELRSASKQLI